MVATFHHNHSKRTTPHNNNNNNNNKYRMWWYSRITFTVFMHTTSLLFMQHKRNSAAHFNRTVEMVLQIVDDIYSPACMRHCCGVYKTRKLHNMHVHDKLAWPVIYHQLGSGEHTSSLWLHDCINAERLCTVMHIMVVQDLSVLKSKAIPILSPLLFMHVGHPYILKIGRIFDLLLQCG